MPARQGVGPDGESRVTLVSDSEVYYDPYDSDIDADPFPVWKRLRDEALRPGVRACP